MITMSLILLAYLLGSVSSAVIVCKLFKLPDPRLSGSKNPGATNVLRLAGKKFAAIVLIGDLIKGLLPVLLVASLGGSQVMRALVAGAAVLGHVFPLYYRFKGGKGVATALGAYWGLHPLLGLLSSLTWVIVFKLFGYSSLSSIVMIILAPFYAWIWVQHVGYFFILLLISCIILLKHKENIKRLMAGIESKMTKHE